MKKNILLPFLAFFAITVVITSCKKDKVADSVDTSAQVVVHSEDQAMVSGESDAVLNDVNDVLESTPGFGGRAPVDVSNILCNATRVIDSTATHRRVTITYNGLNCQGTRNRRGVVRMSMPLSTRWFQPGAVLTIDVDSLRITRVSDNRGITINGTKTITNVTGGRLINLPTIGTIVHEIVSTGISVTFDDGSSRIWRIAKRRSFTLDNGLVIRTIGMHTDGAITGISEWGINRFGNPFVTSITEPMVIRENCQFRLVRGQVTHQRMAVNVVTTFGLDSTGNPVTSCPNGPLYLKSVYTGPNGNTVITIRPY